MRTVRICGVLLTQCTMLWVRFAENIAACALLLYVSHASTVLSKHEVGVELLFWFFWDRGRKGAGGQGGRGYLPGPMGQKGGTGRASREAPGSPQV